MRQADESYERKKEALWKCRIKVVSRWNRQKRIEVNQARVLLFSLNHSLWNHGVGYHGTKKKSKDRNEIGNKPSQYKYRNNKAIQSESSIGTEASTRNSIVSRRDLHGNRESTQLFLENRLIASEGDRETRHMKEEKPSTLEINSHRTNTDNNNILSESSIATEASSRDGISRRDLHGNRESTRLFLGNRLIASVGDRETRHVKEEAHWKCRIKVVS
ncbi:hypothetical protein CDAR_67891 [Caerostris darwini]|uniref:Uncharacterized protein n=1 Tax=Caerostris darwini TaxID=1538125 RepID=A0AAV4VTY4_9ARAC|nr:hypothetical protein CDAR_67891 [Caerostris darwini]